MLEIKNLSQLKKAINAKKVFTIVKHGKKPEYAGQIRIPSVIQTNGFYSVIHEDPGHAVSNMNYGKGSWIEYGKAADWEFINGHCFLYRGEHAPENLVWEIVFE